VVAGFMCSRSLGSCKFFFSSRRRHTRFKCDWSSDVCSSDLPSCPIPEVARLGRTLRQWRAAFLAYFDTSRSSNGGTEAINGLIEIGRAACREREVNAGDGGRRQKRERKRKGRSDLRLY